MADRQKSPQGPGQGHGQNSGHGQQAGPGGSQGRPQPASQGVAAGQGGAAGALGDVTERAREGLEHLGGRVREGVDTAREELGRRYRGVEGSIARNPGQSILMGFGVGVGVGVLLGLALTRRDSSWGGYSLPRSVRDWPERVRQYAGQVPDSVRRGVRQHLPEGLAEYLPGH